MADENIQIGADTGGTESVLNRLSDSLLKQTQILENFGKAFDVINQKSDSSDRVLAKFASSLASQAKSLKSSVSDVSKLASGFDKLVASIERYTEVVRDANKVVSKTGLTVIPQPNVSAQAKSAATKGTESFVNFAFPDIDKKLAAATDKEKAVYEQLKSNLRNLLATYSEKDVAGTLLGTKAGKTGGVKELFYQIQSGATEAANAIENRFLKAIIELSNAEKQLGAETAAVTAKQQDLLATLARRAALKAEGKAFSELLVEKFQPPAAATAPEVARLTLPIGKIQTLIQAEITSSERVFEILDLIEKKTDLTFTGVENRIASYIKSILQAYEAFGRASERANEKAAVGARAIQAQTFAGTALGKVQASIGSLDPTKIATSKYAAIGAVLNRIQETLIKTGVSAAQADKILDSIIAKTPVAFSGKDENRVYDLLSRLIGKYEQLYNAQNKVAKAPSQPINVGVAQGLVSQLGGVPQKATFIGQGKIQADILSISNALAKGKFTAQDLQIALQNLQSGGRAFQLITRETLTADAALRRLVQSLATAETAGLKFGRSILLSFSNVAHLVQYQIAFTVFGNILNEISGSAAKFAELSIKLQEIQTISQKDQIAVEELSSALVKASNSYGLPLIDVAKAHYEALSNQIAQGADAVRFLDQALQFSRVTVSTAEESVNLLSSVINSYGLSATDAEIVSAKLFKTIELGRVKAGELANTLGRVLGPAASLKIPLDDILAAIDVLTIKGVRFNEAYTLINNLLLKLVKPTEALSEHFKELGFNTAEEAVRALGFEGILKELDKAARSGGITRIAEEIKDLRGIRAVVGLTANQSLFDFSAAKQATETKNALTDYRKAVELVQNKPGLEFSKQREAIANFFTVEVGKNLVNVFNTLNEAFGGFDQKLKAVFDGMIKVVQPTARLIEAFASLIGQVGAGNTLFKQGAALLTSFGLAYVSIRSAIAAFNVAISIKTALTLKDNVANIANTASLNGIAASAGIAGTRVGLFGRLLGGIKGNLALTGITVGLTLLIDAIAQSSAALADLRNNFGKLGQETADKFKEDTKKALDANISKINEEKEAFKKAHEEKTKALFQFSAKSKAEVNELAKQTLIADQKISPKIDKISPGFRARLQPKELDLPALQTEIEKNIRDSEKQVSEITDKFLREGFKKGLVEKANKQTVFDFKTGNLNNNNNPLLNSRSPLLKEVGILQQRAIKLFDEDNLRDARTTLEEADRILKDLFSKQVDVRKKAVGLGVQFTTPIAGPGSLIQSQIEKNGNLRIKLEEEYQLRQVQRFEQAQFFENEIRKAGEKEQELANRNNELYTERVKIFDKTAELALKINEGLAESSKLLENVNKIPTLLGLPETTGAGKGAKAPKKELENLTGQFNNTRNNLNIAVQGNAPFNIQIRLAQELINRQKEINNQIQNQINLKNQSNRNNSSKALPSQIEGVSIQDTLNEALKKVREVETNIVESAKNKGRETDINREIGTVFNKIGDKAADAAVSTAVKFEQAGAAIIRLIDEINTATNNLKNNKPVQLQRGALQDFTGGLTKYMGGGMTLGYETGGRVHGYSGIDNLFAKVTAGEFVTDKANTQKFYPQLKSINSGFDPSKASPNHSVNVGDIHVNINGGGTPQQTALEIGNQIRREIRRGTLRLN